MNFFLSVLLLTADASGESLEHLRVAKWKEMTPQVVICNGLEIETEVVQKAVDYWRSRGEKIGSIRRKSCDEDPLRGEIAIYRGDQLPEEHAGEAFRFIKNEKIPPKIQEITRASIYIQERFNDSGILIQHELGHALGFTDTDDEDSIMSIRGSLY
jgi:hypothetical protein